MIVMTRAQKMRAIVMTRTQEVRTMVIVARISEGEDRGRRREKVGCCTLEDCISVTRPHFLNPPFVWVAVAVSLLLRLLSSFHSHLEAFQILIGTLWSPEVTNSSESESTAQAKRA